MSAQTPASPTATQREPYLPHLPALDGLRALAVIAVVLYHAELPVAGGFLGVEIFFVLSGFLITALLVGEWRQHGRINLAAFWMRRTGRLLPALLLMLGGTCLLALLLPAQERAGLRGDLFAALTYVSNWRLVLSGQSYFDVGTRPSLLQHLWSLAVEEQFYLLWPLLFALGLRWLRPLGLLALTLALALGSLALAFTLYDPGADPSRVYFGSDTRASGLLIGALLAMLWAPWRQLALAGPRIGVALDAAGIGALAGLVAANLWLYDSHPLLYRGGLASVALLTALVIAAATHPHARLLPALLAWAPLRWVGLRSYGIYLWHWPIFQLTRPYLDVPFDGPGWLALRVGLVLLLAELSYRFVELPVRHGAIGKLWRTRPAQAPTERPTWALQSGAIATLAMLTGPQLLTAESGPLGSRSNSEPMSHLHRSPNSHGPTGRSTPPWRRLPILLIGLVVLVSSACSSFIAPPAAGPGPVTPTPEIAAVATVAASPTLTTPTVAASATAAPSATSLPTETATASATPVSAAEATATAEAALPPVDAELAAALQAVLDRTVADGAIPGAVAAVHLPGFQPWVGASGLADRQAATPITPETRVRIASISKVFTAVVVMQLVEEGRLSLDDPLSSWLPELVPDAEAITVRDLLQHTTGLYDYLEDRRYAAQAYQNPTRQFAPSELVAYAAQFPSLFAPGAPNSWDYSSTNYVILGMVVEAVTGNSLASEMRARIFEPLGLDNTFFTPDEPVEPPFATGYSRGTLQRDVAMSFAYATANLVSTAGDVAIFARALFDGELVSDESRAAMLDVVSGKGQYNMPELGYGLGVMRHVLPVGRAPEEATVYGHIGGFGGFRSALWHAPASGVTVALGVNQGSTDPNLLAAPLLDAALSSLGR